MGKFTDALASSGASLIGDVAGGLASSAMDALGIGSAARQYKYNKKLMQEQARLNEQAAEKAYGRTREMYDYDYSKHTYAAMRGQMEDAGLSVGLMYGGGGSAGVGGGSTGEMAQGGASLGAVGPGADYKADPLILTKMKATDAEINLANANAEKARAEAKRIAGETPYGVEKIRQEAVRVWQENLENKFVNLIREDGITDYSIREANKVLNEEFEIGDKAMTVKEMAAEILGKQNQAKLYEKMTDTERAKYNQIMAEAALLKVDFETRKEMNEAQLEKLRKEARKLAIDLGEDYTWRSVMLDICTLLGAAGDLANSISFAKAVFGKDKKAIGQFMQTMKEVAKQEGKEMPPDRKSVV